MDSDVKEYLVGIMDYIRRLEASAIEDARRYEALMKTLEELIPGASAVYTRYYESAAQTLSGRPQLAAIERTIRKLKSS